MPWAHPIGLNCWDCVAMKLDLGALQSFGLGKVFKVRAEKQAALLSECTTAAQSSDGDGCEGFEALLLGGGTAIWVQRPPSAALLQQTLVRKLLC